MAVFVLLTSLTIVAFGLTVWSAAKMAGSDGGLREHGSSGDTEGPVPGYSIYPASALVPMPWINLPGCATHALETFHSNGRTRLVLTLQRTDLGPAADIPGSLARCVSALLSHSGAHVAAVELAADPCGPSVRGDWTAIASHDGRGWSGQDRDAWLVIEQPASGEIL